MWRKLLLVGCATAALTTLAACGSPRGQASKSMSPTPLPFALAPPATPKPGQPFVGYWSTGGARLSVEDPGVAIPIEVLRHGKGYAVSVDGGPGVPVPLVRGRLSLNRFGPWVFGAFPIELLWRRGRCVLSLGEGRYAPGPAFLILSRQDRAAFVKTVDGVADYETWRELIDLAGFIQGWASRTHEPPAPSQLRPGSAFVRWIRSKLRTISSKLGTWPWPRNPFTGQPMADSSSPGDFTYTVKGRSWKLIGHQSDGGTWDALKGFPNTVPTESPSPGT